MINFYLSPYKETIRDVKIYDIIDYFVALMHRQQKSY